MARKSHHRREVSPPGNEPRKIAEIGELIYQQLARKIERSNRDEFIVINIQTNEHVIASTRDEAMDRYEELFGPAPGYLRRIGDLDYAGTISL